MNGDVQEQRENNKSRTLLLDLLRIFLPCFSRPASNWQGEVMVNMFTSQKVRSRMQSGPMRSLLVRDRCGTLEPRVAILSESEQGFEAGLAEMGVSSERARDSAVFHHAKA